MDIEIRQLCKSYGTHMVLNNFSGHIKEGCVTALMAPSGHGKTTLLRILMGLEIPDSGQLLGLTDRKRSAVFQEDRLCENLSAVSNIRLVNPAKHKSEIIAAMEAVGLTGCHHQPVRELSGGMRRRVAILRALMTDYDILFLDEPFKGLDWKTKELVMEDTLKRISGKTVLFVTHDPQEAHAMGAKDNLFQNFHNHYHGNHTGADISAVGGAERVLYSRRKKFRSVRHTASQTGIYHL